MNAPAPTPVVTTTVTVTRTVTPTPAGPTKPAASTSTAIVVAAIIAVCGVALTGLISLLIGRRTARAAEQSARAAEKSSQVNESTAIGLAQRALADALGKRYQDASAQLGHSAAAVRLAGTYALARLADDWPDERQRCVNVLCAYLRMSWAPPLDGTHDDGELQVRRSILEEIGQHLVPSRLPNWCDLDFDLSNTLLPGFAFIDIQFRRRPSFYGTRFTGRSVIGTAVFNYGGNLGSTMFDGIMDIADITVLSGDLHLLGAVVNPRASLRLNTRFIAPSCWLQLNSLQCRGHTHIDYNASVEPQGTVTAMGVSVYEGGDFTMQPIPHFDSEPPDKTAWPVVSPTTFIDMEPGGSVYLPDSFEEGEYRRFMQVEMDPNTVRWIRPQADGA